MGGNRKRRQNKKKGSSTAQADSNAPLKTKGDKAFLAGLYEDAINFYTQAIEEDAKNASLYSNRSAAYTSLQKGDNALADASKCIELRPDWHKGYLRRADALEKMYRYPEAKQAYEAGLKIDSEDALLKDGTKRMQDIMEELQLTPAQMSTEANPDKDRFSNMIQWMKEGGAAHPMLYLRYYSQDYRGIHALCKIPNNSQILYVPHSHIMTSEVAKGSEIGKKIISSGCDLRSKHSYLAAYLLQEKHTNSSFWRPYMDILPTKYRNMPIFFEQKEMDMLKGSFVHDKIYDRRMSLKQEYEAICKSVPEFSDFTEWEFIWGRLVVITRIFGLVIKGKKTDGLVPYADMLNHRRPRETTWTFDDDQYGFTIVATRNISRGGEVYDSYGRKCNSRYFVNYGFALEENEDNECVLRIGLPKTDPHYSTKIGVLGGYARAAQREFQIPANYREKKTKALFSFARFVQARDEEMMALPSDGAKVDDIDQISVRNELATLKQLSIAARAVLNGFPTTLEEDEKLLTEFPGYCNERNCIIMRMGEKRVLHWFLDLQEKCAPMLTMQWKDIKKIAQRAYMSDDPVDVYITQVVVPLVKGPK
jgi:protein-histidine N-methyltransferase